MTKSVLFFKFGFLQRLPGFIHKNMEALFVEEQQSAISQLMTNLESQPVTKGSSDSKYSIPFNRIKGYVVPFLYYPDILQLLHIEVNLRWLKMVSSTFQVIDFHGLLLPLFISWCQNHGITKLPNIIIGEEAGVIFMTQQVAIVTLWPAKNILNFNFKYMYLQFKNVMVTYSPNKGVPTLQPWEWVSA